MAVLSYQVPASARDVFDAHAHLLIHKACAGVLKMPTRADFLAVRASLAAVGAPIPDEIELTADNTQPVVANPQSEAEVIAALEAAFGVKMS
jgi:hypothetical protein